jgi:hypothetical protein
MLKSKAKSVPHLNGLQDSGKYYLINKGFKELYVIHMQI